MPADFRITKPFIRWCTNLPEKYCTLESPAFKVNGNEWCLRLAHESCREFSRYSLYMQSKCGNPPTKDTSFSVEFKVGYEDDKTSNLGEGVQVFNSNKPMWSIYYYEVERQKLIKFLFSFKNLFELKYRDEMEVLPEDIVGWRAQNWSKCQSQEHQLSSNSGTNVHLEALSRDLSKLLDESSSADVKITCEGKTFQAHSIILETRSAVFSEILQNDMVVDIITGLFKVEDFSSSIFESFLRYLYSGILPELDVDTAKQFYEIAGKYAVEELRKACSELLAENLSGRNACDMLVMADKHSDENFRRFIISYIATKNIPECDTQWPDFCKKYPILAIDVLSFREQRNNHFKRIVKNSLRWLCKRLYLLFLLLFVVFCFNNCTKIKTNIQTLDIP